MHLFYICVCLLTHLIMLVCSISKMLNFQRAFDDHYEFYDLNQCKNLIKEKKNQCKNYGAIFGINNKCKEGFFNCLIEELGFDRGIMKSVHVFGVMGLGKYL